MLLSKLEIFSEIAGPITSSSVTSVARESTLLLEAVFDSPVLGELDCVPKLDFGRLLRCSSTSCLPPVVSTRPASSSSSSSWSVFTTVAICCTSPIKRSILLWSVVSLSEGLEGIFKLRFAPQSAAVLDAGCLFVPESVLPWELSSGEEDESFVKFCEFDLVVFDPEIALSMPSRMMKMYLRKTLRWVVLRFLMLLGGGYRTSNTILGNTGSGGVSHISCILSWKFVL